MKKHLIYDSPRELPRDLPRELPRDLTRDLPRNLPCDLQRDHHFRRSGLMSNYMAKYQLAIADPPQIKASSQLNVS